MKSVCVDLDGVIARYEGWKGWQEINEPLPGAKKFLEELSQFARVIIFTVRCCLQWTEAESLDVSEREEAISARQKFVEDWLKKHSLYFDEVYVGQGKPLAAAYVDDRAVVCEPQEFAWDYDSALERSRTLCKVAK